jgi:hypothetical protein
MTAKQDTRRTGMSRPQLAVAVLAGAAVTALAALAFIGMFTTVKTEMVPFFHHLAWIVPAGVDTGIVALIAVGILLEWLGMPMPALYYVALAFMGASVWLNVSAAHGSPTGAVGHAALPVLFIACIEAIRHAVRRTAGMANGTVRDGIPVARWILAPAPSFFMFRRMVLQRINSYPNAAALELGRRRAIAQLRAMSGPQWKKTAPGDLVWMLQKGVSVADAIARVAELTGTPLPVPKITGPVPGSGPDPHQDRETDRPRQDQDQDQPATFRSRDELQDQALAAIAAHWASEGVRMNNKQLGRAIRVSNDLAGELRHEIKDREEAAA